MIALRVALQRPGGFALDVDLRLPAQGATAVFGASGCGKTTLLRCLAGLERATAAHIVVDGQVWQDPRRALAPHERAVGVVFQDAALFPHLTVRANLDFGRLRAAQAAARVPLTEIVDLLGLAPLLDRHPAHLSGGERQRVAIARALAVGPRLLLMDEPLASLDAQRKAEFLPYLDRLREALTVPLVYVSHSMDEVARIADHLVLLEAGHVLAQGPLAEMSARLDLPTRLAEDAGVVLPATVIERDPAWQLARLDLGGHCVWTRDPGRPPGARVRLRVLARDVGVALAPAADTSIANQLPGVVDAAADDAHPALTLLRLRLNGTDAAPGPRLLARVTRRSFETLGLTPGRAVWAQVKTVALTV